MRRGPLLALLPFGCLALAGLASVPGARAAEDLPALVAALGGKDPGARQRAYQSLARARDPAAIPLLAREMPSFDAIGQVYGTLLLDAYPPGAARGAWRSLLEKGTPYLRVCAGSALLAEGDERGVAAMAEAIRDPRVDPVTRVRMIARVGPRPPAPVLDSLRLLLQPAADLRVLAQALGLFHARQDRPAGIHARRLLADPRPGVRAMARAYLHELGWSDQAAPLGSDLAEGVGHVEFGFVQQVLSTGRRVPDPVLDGVAARLGREKDAALLVKEIAFLGSHRHAKARPALRPLLAHPNEAVARAAFDVLVLLSGPVDEDTLRPLLAGPDAARRLWAADGLRRRDDHAGLPEAVRALRSGAVPERRTAARLLGGYVTDLSVPPLLDALADENVEVRGAAGEALARLLSNLFPYRVFDLRTTGWAPDADPATRGAAIATLRAWWDANRAADW